MLRQPARRNTFAAARRPQSGMPGVKGLLEDALVY